MRLHLTLLADLTGFSALLACAWIARWTPGELAWGMWTSGFTLVILWLAVMSLLLFKQDGFRLRSMVTTLVAVGIAGWAFVWVYRFYGELLDLGYPLLPDPDRIQVNATTWRNVRPFALRPTLLAAFNSYYVVIAVSIWPMILGLRRAWPSADQFRLNPGLNGGAFARLHFTLMALILLQMIFQQETGPTVFLSSAVVLAISYFPWQRISLLRKNSSANVTEPARTA